MWTSLQVLILLASLCLSVRAASFIQPEWGYYFDQDDQGPGTYTYGYDIEDPVSHNIQFRRERRLPNGTVTGSYGLVEPDGNVKIVHYTADHLGYRATIENSQRPNESYPPPTERSWAGHRPPWDTLWYRDRPIWDKLWYRQQSPILSHALASQQTLASPVLEQHTPPALQGSHTSSPQQNLNEAFVQEGSSPQGDVFRGDASQEDHLDYVFRVGVPQEDHYLAGSVDADQSQNYPTFELPPSDVQ